MSDLKNTPAPVPIIDFNAIAKDMPTSDTPAAPAAKPVAAAPAAQVEGEVPVEGAAPVPEEGPFKKGFEQLVKGQAALRAEREQVKHATELAKSVSPVQSAALAKALASGDALGAMNALGFSYADIASRVAGSPPKGAEAKPPTAAAEPPKPTDDPELAAIKAHYRATQQAEQKTAILTGIKGVVTGDKFKNIVALDAHEGVMGVIDEMFARTGALPSNDANETIAIAAEEFERRLASGEIPLTRAQWEKVAGLTTPGTPAPTVPEATRERPGNAPVSSGSKTLTNKVVAPRAPTAPPTDPRQIYTDLAKDPNLPWS